MQANGRNGASRGTIRAEAAWVLAARVATALAAFFAIRWLTGVMPEALYGRYSLFLGLLALVSSFFVGPHTVAQTRFLHDVAKDGDLRAFVRWSVGSGVAAGALGGLLAAPVAWWYFRSESSALLAAALIPAIACAQAVGTRQFALFNTYRWRGRFAVQSVIEAWLRPALVAGMVLFMGASIGMCAIALLVHYVAVVAIGTPWLFELARQSPHRRGAARPLDHAAMREFASPFFGIALLTWGLSVSDRYLIAWLLGDELAGRYVASYQLGAVAPSLLASVFFPLLAPILYQRMADAKGKPLTLDSFLLAMALPAIGAGAMITSDVDGIASMLLRRAGYRTGDEVAPWVLAGLTVLVLQQVLEHEAHYQKKSRGLLVANGIAVVVNVGLNLALLRQMGIRAAALSTCLAYLTSLVSVIVIYRPAVSWRTWVRIAYCLAIAAAGVLIARSLVAASMPGHLRVPLRWLVCGGFFAVLNISNLRALLRWAATDRRVGEPGTG